MKVGNLIMKVCFRKVFVAVWMMVCVLLIPCGVYAHESVPGGSGDGPGVPLYMRKSSIYDGQKDIPLDATITLYYSHNVADAAVQSNNRNAISMKDSSGNSVSITVSFSSVFEYRQEVYIQSGNLQPGTTYTITISPDFMSRNGYTVGHTDTLSFTTVNSTGAGEDQPSGSDGGTDNSQDTSAQDNTSENNVTETPESKETVSNGSEAAGTANVDTAEQNVQQTDDAADAEAKEESQELTIEEQKLQQAMEEGIVEETSEKEIQKVSDLEPGKVETSAMPEKDFAVYGGLAILFAGCVLSQLIRSIRK